MKKTKFYSFTCFLIFLLMGNDAIIGQEIKTVSTISKYQINLNAGYPYWISRNTENAYNKRLEKTPISLGINLQKNQNKLLSYTLGMFFTKAQEKNPLVILVAKMGTHNSSSVEFGLKLTKRYEKVNFFAHPQFGVSMYVYPALSAEGFSQKITRTESRSFGISMSSRIGAEILIANSWYLQPAIMLKSVRTFIGGEYEVTEFNQISYDVSEIQFLMCNFSIGIGKYFGSK